MKQHKTSPLKRWASGAILALSSFVGMTAQGQDVISTTTYEALVDSADACIRSERWLEGISCIRQALQMEPASFSNALLLSNMGVAYTHVGNYSEALKAFETGLAITPRSTVLLSNRARTFIEMHRLREACDDLSAALAIDPTLDWERKMRGMLHTILENHDEGIADLKKYLSSYPSDTDALQMLAESYMRIGQENDALECYGKALAADSTDGALCFNYALALITLERFGEASEVLREGIKANPQDADLFLLRAYMKRLQHLNSESDADLKIALDNGVDLQLLEQFFPKKK